MKFFINRFWRYLTGRTLTFEESKKEFHELELKWAKERVSKIEAYLKKYSGKFDFPKAQRALLFFEARPLKQYQPPRDRLFCFLKELGIEIEKTEDLGGKDQVLKWFAKAEAILPEGKTDFEDIEKLTVS